MKKTGCSVAVRRVLEPHTPCDRRPDGTWLDAPYGRMLSVAGGERVVRHSCGDHLSAVSAGHLARHQLTLADYRTRVGLNRKASLVAPVLAEARAEEGRRRLASSARVRDGLALGQAMARDGTLVTLGQAAQPPGYRSAQGRTAASREGASVACGLRVPRSLLPPATGPSVHPCSGSKSRRLPSRTASSRGDRPSRKDRTWLRRHQRTGPAGRPLRQGRRRF